MTVATASATLLIRLSVPTQERRPALPHARRRLFAEIGAAAPPTPGTETWWAAVREAVYVPLEGSAQYVRETVNWTGQTC